MNNVDWLSWSKQGINGNDAAAIVGIDEHKTSFQLWEEKTESEVKESPPSFMQQKIMRMSPKIRALFELQVGESFNPAMVQMEGFEFIRSSIHGRCESGEAIIDIRLAGKEDWATTTDDKVPDKCWPRIQHNIMVSGAKFCFFLSYLPISNTDESIHAPMLKVVKVYPEKSYQGFLLEEHIKFWDLVQKKKPPVISDRDFKTIKGHAKLGAKFRSLTKKSEQIAEELVKVRNALIAAAAESKHPRCIVGGINVTQVARAGNVDYKKVPQLAGIDLEQYRGKGSLSWRVEEQKEEKKDG